MSARLVLSICVAILLSAGIGPAKGDLQDGLVSHYKLDEDGGDIAADSSGNGYDGELSGDVQWAPGRFEGALSYGGEDTAHVQIPATGISASAGTIAVWGYLTDPQPPQTRYFFGHTTQPPYNNRIQLYMDGSNTELDLGLGDTHTRQTSIMTLDTKAWYHVALTWDGSNYVVYVNGEEVATGTYTGLSAIRDFLWIGNDGNPETEGVEAFGGLLDDVRIYDRAILADEVKELFNLPASPRGTAWSPDPPDGDVTVITPLFQWEAAPTARLHEVYFGTDPNLGPDDLVQPRSPMVLYYHPPGLIPGTTYYWRVDAIEADMTTVHTGKVWTFTARPYTAYVPDPADGANGASPDPNLTLSWGAGISAAEHHLYFGGSFDDVNDGAADTDKGTLTETTFVLAEPLEPLTTYYWRVDEIGAGGTLQAGAVWSFTTFSAVEDFESYTDDIDAGEAIFQTWMDGFENGTGSTAGYFESANGTFNETTIVNSGGQSMPLDYNNVVSPYYSEVERTWTVPQDWTVNGVDALVLYVRGSSDNGVEPLYVAVADSASRLGVAVHPDPAIVTTRDWAKWEVPLSEFTAAGVNLTAVKKMIIGLGDRNAPTPGGAGLVYIDDIRLTRP